MEKDPASRCLALPQVTYVQCLTYVFSSPASCTFSLALQPKNELFSPHNFSDLFTVYLICITVKFLLDLVVFLYLWICNVNILHRL